MKRTILMLTLIALLGLIATAAFAQPPAGQGQGKGWMAQLTQEQRTQLQTKMKDLRAANAKPEEIKAAVAELCKDWGLEPPHDRALLMLELTQDQRTQLQAKMKEMRAANATPEEIKAAVAELFKDWGVEMPQGGQGAGNGDRLGTALTEEQWTQLEAKIKELRNVNAKSGEIRTALAELYKGWGLETPQGGRQGGQGAGHGNRFGANLTDEQRTQLQAKIKELRAANTKPEEMKAAIAGLFKTWGLEPPQGGKGGEGRGALKGPLQDLTDEQRQQVLTKMDEMKKAGSTPEEIKQTIREMVKGFGDKV